MREFLITQGYGAGWSTWNSKHKHFALFDKTLIDMKKRNASTDEVDAYIKEQLKGEYFYVGGWKNVVVSTCSDDGKFIVEEYDGNESIRIKDDEHWL